MAFGDAMGALDRGEGRDTRATVQVPRDQRARLVPSDKAGRVFCPAVSHREAHG